MLITYGNRRGKWVTESRFVELEWVAQTLNERFGIDGFHLWYDAEEDYHCMKFVANDTAFFIRLYKIFALQIEGSEFTYRYQREYVHELIHRVWQITGLKRLWPQVA